MLCLNSNHSTENEHQRKTHLTRKRKYLGEDKHSPERVDELVTSSLEQGPQYSCNTTHRLIYGTISARRAVPENTAFLSQRTARSAHPAGERVAFITENVRLTVRLERVFDGFSTVRALRASISRGQS